MAKNKDLGNAKNAKNDEFYTQLEDINTEMVNYEDKFKGKTILMNCDDPTWSNFWRYFHLEFERLGLKKIIATHYEYEEIPSYMMEYTGGNDENFEAGKKTELTQNGDFRSNECIELLKEADIVITNPPFSMFREFISLLMEYDKKFIVLSNMNSITYKEFFPLIKENKVWIGNGFNVTMIFKTPYPNLLESNRKYVISKGYNPDDGYVKNPAIAWFTNLDLSKRHERIETTYKYSRKDELYPELYPKYANYDAINVDKVSEIPMDYMDKMGVPITFLDKYNPDQFEIIGLTSLADTMDSPVMLGQEFVDKYRAQGGTGHFSTNMYGVWYTDEKGQAVKPYGRIIIRRKVEE